jgi:hypothetical protein
MINESMKNMLLLLRGNVRSRRRRDIVNTQVNSDFTDLSRSYTF